MMRHRFLSSFLPIIFAAFFPLFAGTVLSSPVADWHFDDPAGTPLTGLANRAGESVFTADGNGLAASGDGVLRIRRGLSGGALYYAPLDLESDRPVWLGVEIKGWDLHGPAEEAMRFGLAHEAASGGGFVDIRMERTEEDVVAIQGIGHGGGTPVEPRPLFSNPRPSTLWLALEYDPSEHRYAIYHREESGDWKHFGTGATRSGLEARYLRLNVVNRFNDHPEEHFDIGRIFISQSPFFETGPAAGEPGSPPFVSAVSWAVADARTGRILGAKDPGAFRKTASITKSMTAMIVVRLAEENPSVLEETIVFSESAAAARGSHTGLRAGESLSVRDALYGLMLPSGNDAGNAIAEHFNDRFDPPEDPDSLPSSRIGRHHFVAEMNRTAATLGMGNTIYRIPFGDGGAATDHTSTAEDLILLARAAFQYPLFRQVVGTRTHAATVGLPDGGTREIEWTNTNQLLAREGYDGIKTGTTTLAGACLLSTGFRGDNRLFAVVLGSAYRERRFMDTEALFEWAWETFFPSDD